MATEMATEFAQYLSKEAATFIKIVVGSANGLDRSIAAFSNCCLKHSTAQYLPDSFGMCSSYLSCAMAQAFTISIGVLP